MGLNGAYMKKENKDLFYVHISEIGKYNLKVWKYSPGQSITVEQC